MNRRNRLSGGGFEPPRTHQEVIPSCGSISCDNSTRKYNTRFRKGDEMGKIKQMTRKETEKFLIEECGLTIEEFLINCFCTEYGELDLSGLNFGKFTKHIYLTNMKVGGDLKQGHQIVKGELHQGNQIVGGNLDQSDQEIGGKLYD